MSKTRQEHAYSEIHACTADGDDAGGRDGQVRRCSW